MPLLALCLLLGVLAAGPAAAAPEITAEPASLDFGFQPVGTRSDPQTVFLRNTGDVELRILDIGTMGPGSLDFEVAGGSVQPFTLTPGDSRSVQVVFEPLIRGARSADLAVLHTVPGSPLLVPLSGVGADIAPLPALSASAARLQFGLQPVGVPSPSRALTLRNTGSADLRITTLGITGTNAAAFAVVSGGGSPVTIRPGDSRVLRLVFTPAVAGPQDAVLTVTSNAQDSPLVVPLLGAGAAPEGTLTANPPSLEFDEQPLGTTSDPRMVTILNSGTRNVEVTTLAVTGLSTLDFEIADRDRGPFTLQPGGSRVIGILFTPLAPGSREADLAVTYNALESPLLVPLIGSGGGSTPAPPPAATARVRPSAVNFGPQAVSVASEPRPVTITNTGAVDLLLTGLRITGDQSEEFRVQAGAGDATVAPGRSRTLLVTFAPQAVGRRGATLSIQTNSPGSPHTVVLSGSGTAVQEPPVAAADWPVLLGGPRQLGLTGAAADPRTLTGWSAPLGSRPGTSPVALGGIVFIGTEADGVVAIDTSRRVQLWQRPLPAPVRSAPAAGSDVVAVSANGLYGLGAADGRVLWQRDDIVAGDGVSPMRIDNTILIASRDPAAVHAVDALSGADVWPEPIPLPSGLVATATVAASPELGLLFVGMGPPDPTQRIGVRRGAVVALRIEDGGAEWTSPVFLPAGPPPTGLSVGWAVDDPSLSTPTPAVFLAAGPTVTALNAASGELLWTRTLPETDLRGPPVLSTAAPREAALFVGGDSGRIYILSSSTGADAVTRPTPPLGVGVEVAPSPTPPVGTVAGTMALAENLLYVPTTEGLVALDVRTGLVIWRTPLAAASGVAVAGGIPYVATAQGELIGFSR